MGNDGTPRDRYRDDNSDYGQDYGQGRNDIYSSGRDYASSSGASAGGRDRDDGRDQDRGYGRGGQGQGGGYGRDAYNRDRDGGFDQRPASGYGQAGQAPRSGYDRDRGFGGQGGGYGQRQGSGQSQGRGQGRGGPQGDERGFFDRAGDEVRSWFGDEEAERRRDADQRFYEQQQAATDRDYSSWRDTQISAFDRDYDEYRQENRQKFHSEFGAWRTERQTQRSSLEQVTEHMEVLGSDGQHVGTVDKVSGDKIILTKNDKDAGGHHHSIPSRWIQSVDDKVTIRKTADEAKREWKDVENKSAMFGEYQDRARPAGSEGGQQGGYEGGSTNLNRSFSGTYGD